MDDISNEESTPRGVSRRDFVTRSAIMGGMVWAAPAISTLGGRAFAQPQDGGSPFVADDCDQFFRFKFEIDDGNVEGKGFTECSLDSAEASCPNAAYQNADLPCIEPTVDPLVGRIVDKNGNWGGETVTVVVVNEYKLTFTVSDGCEIRNFNIKAGPQCVDGVKTSDSTVTVEVSGNAISNVTGVLCCDDIGTTD